MGQNTGYKKHPGGRPLAFKTVKELETAISRYFAECEIKDLHPTITGLAVALEVDRKTINNYQDRAEFFPTIKRAKAKIEEHLEQCLFGNSVTGVIFNLKNNFDWKDKQEIDQTIHNATTPDHVSANIEESQAAEIYRNVMG